MIWTCAGRAPDQLEVLSNMMISELLVGCCLCPLAFSDLRASVDGVVTCSDASMMGGGACASSCITEGAERFLASGGEDSFRSLGAMRSSEEWPLAELDVSSLSYAPLLKTLAAPFFRPRVLVVGLFDGIAGLLVSVSRLPVLVIGFVTSEIDSAAKRLVRKRWPGVIELGSICDISGDKISRLAGTYAAAVDLVLIGAGSPCQDLSALLAGGLGLEGPRSKLFFEIPRVVDLFKTHFNCPVHYFVENVFSMTPENRQKFSEVLGITPVLCDAVHFSWCRRPRLFWMSWDLFPRNEVQKIWRGDCWEVLPKVQKIDRQAWVSPGWTWAGNASALPTFTRALPSARPPRRPAGLEDASVEAIDRWEKDEYCFQVYQYEAQFMLTSLADGSLRLPDIHEREVLMGFDRGYTKAAVSSKMGARAAFIQQAQQLGNSFSCSVVCYLVADLLCQLSFISLSLPLELGNAVSVAPEPWAQMSKFSKGKGPSPNGLEQDLVWEYLRRAERSGCDVRLDLGIPFRSKAWPRAGLNSNLWNWQIIHGYQWDELATSHINHFELIAVLNCVRWRLRKVSQLRSRFLHLIDNQVVAAILTKGRTSSLQLRHTLRKINSFVLAGNIYPAWGFVNSEDNPADIPSRWAVCRKRRLGA